MKNQDIVTRVVKPFATAAMHVVLQSRLAGNASNRRRANFFGLAVDDIPSAAVELKKILSDGFLCKNKPLCLDISIKIDEEDYMLLETWTFRGKFHSNDSCPVTSQDLYFRFSIMLKSLIATTRSLPAYRLIKKLDEHSYKVCYRFHEGELQNESLDDRFKEANISQSDDALGKVSMSVTYRIDMWKKTQTIRRIDTRAEDRREKTPVDWDRPMKLGAFVDSPDGKNRDPDFPREPTLVWLTNFIDSVPCETTEPPPREDPVEEPPVEKHKSIWISEEDPVDRFKYELNCPFASKDSRLSQLAMFFRLFNDCDDVHSPEIAPSPVPPPPMDIESLDAKLQIYENNAEKYDKMLEELDTWEAL